MGTPEYQTSCQKECISRVDNNSKAPLALSLGGSP